jgi:tRNA synthetases class I (I, L, M and V)
VIGGDYITTEAGTGLVHTAPGHGQEDYQTGLKYGLELLSPVDDAGCFTDEAGDRFKGLSVLKEGNEVSSTYFNSYYLQLNRESLTVDRCSMALSAVKSHAVYNTGCFCMREHHIARLLCYRSLCSIARSCCEPLHQSFKIFFYLNVKFLLY